jgi:diacylglycerol kinase family enzyme
VNPRSRRGLRHREKALHALIEAGCEVREVVTSHPGHASEVIRARNEIWDAVFVLGGDGTVMEVVSALAYSGIPIARAAGRNREPGRRRAGCAVRHPEGGFVAW